MRTDLSGLKCLGSTADERIAFIRNLSKRKVSEESGCFFLEGERAINEVPLEAGVLRTVVLSRTYYDGIGKEKGRRALLARLDAVCPEFLLVTDKLFAQFADTVTPQGIGAVVNRPEFQETEELLKRARRVLVLENLQDPGNLGTCIRTADAFGFDAVLCVDNCADIYNPKVLRSTVGSLFHIPVKRYDGGIYKLSVLLKVRGLKVYAADPHNGIECSDPEFGASRTAVIIGNEARGLTDSARNCADSLVMIRMPGSAESLNASVAAAVLMYELAVKR